MGLFSSIKRRMGYFIQDCIRTAQTSLPDRELQERLLGLLDEPPSTLYATGPMPSIERHTDSIDERAVQEALRAQKSKDTEGIPAVKAKPLEVDVVKGLIKQLPAGELTRMYRDAHREDPMGEWTQEIRAIRRTDKLENRGNQ